MKKRTKYLILSSAVLVVGILAIVSFLGGKSMIPGNNTQFIDESTVDEQIARADRMVEEILSSSAPIIAPREFSETSDLLSAEQNADPARNLDRWKHGICDAGAPAPRPTTISSLRFGVELPTENAGADQMHNKMREITEPILGSYDFVFSSERVTQRATTRFFTHQDYPAFYFIQVSRGKDFEFYFTNTCPEPSLRLW